MPPGVEEVPFGRLLEESDVVSLHCPLTESTRGIIGAEALRRMKPTAILLNTSRGPLVDEAALAAALREGRIAAAGVDVLSTEPPQADNPLLSAPNCWISPHIAWATKAARIRLVSRAAENYAAYLAGKPINVV
jgi:glycerate dehydrogenase